MPRDVDSISDAPVSQLRENGFNLEHAPTTWCPGCGDGIIVQALLRALIAEHLDNRKVGLVAGIGCFGHAGEYLDFDFFHALHGRCLATATGLKLARPDLKVIALIGDGDGLAIGGNHFIHAARRNIDLTVIMFNNSVYGRTGGQVSPTSWLGTKLQTAPYGMIEQEFDPCAVALGAGAGHVGRITVYHAQQMKKMFQEALQHPGFSFIEVIQNCHVMLGRYNDMGGATEMILGYRDRAISVHTAKKLSAEELKGRIVIGKLRQEEFPELTAQHAELARRVATEKPPRRGVSGDGAAQPGKRIGRREVMLSGTGGQGLQLAGTILVEAAGILAGYQAIQVQNYGPAIRGGVSTSEVVIADEPVLHPRAETPDVLLAMSQAAFDTYASKVKDGGFILYDPLFVTPSATTVPAHAVAMTEIADRVGKRVVANVVAVGALAKLMGFFKMDQLERALLARVPKGTDELNRQALHAGYDSIAG